MKKILFAMLLAASISAQAQTICPTLDYQEMKEMTPTELVKEYCRNADDAHDNMLGVIDNIMDDSVKKVSYNAAYDSCINQNKRILRILKDAKPTCS